jgi:hypothetical protein
MQYGYKCEDCEVAIFPTTTRSELAWLRDRIHIAREVAKHSSNGLDTWMMEGLEFLATTPGTAYWWSNEKTKSGFGN